MIGGNEDGFQRKPEVSQHPPLDNSKVLLCYCQLSGEFHIGTQAELCEVCDGAQEFNVENVKRAFTHLQTERIVLTDRINQMVAEREESKRVR